ncbi:hypothetical protein [Brochothrix thermosphacta]|uniref:hypothetical protein n=1 Tax=Brochothrix thermosphacta TaxID=2756 RepID=UPI003F9A5FDC
MKLNFEAKNLIKARVLLQTLIFMVAYYIIAQYQGKFSWGYFALISFLVWSVFAFTPKKDRSENKPK